MNTIQAGFSLVRDTVYQNSLSILPLAVSTAVQLGVEDRRIGKIIGGAGLIGSGLTLVQKSGLAAKRVESKNGINRGAAVIGFAATCYGVYMAAMGVLELMNPTGDQQNLYLVCHDNKPKSDKRAGYLLPRLGVVDGHTGAYTAVAIEENNPLANSKDLESLRLVQDNEYVACESKGRCFHFKLDQSQEGVYSASVIHAFKLPVPEDRFYNIEAVALKNNGTEICWSHRGGIFAGEEPWTRCGPLDIESGSIPSFTEQTVADPFAITNKLNRAISDQAVGAISGSDYFMATIDTEGSEGIAATEDQAYSILYTHDQCLALFPDEKVEGLVLDRDESKVVFATDNEAAGSKVCEYDLSTEDLSCLAIRTGEEYGVGGIAPII